MEERNPMEGKARIVGLDLSKKTFVGCNLTVLESVEKGPK